LHVIAVMRTKRLHHEPTTLEVMDHVLGKGMLVEGEGADDTTGRRRAIDGLGLFEIDTHVEIVTALDGGTLKNTPGA
jgi:hypothetical protein